MDLFADFLLGTGEEDFDEMGGFTNLLTRNGYMLKLLLRGTPGFETLQGGKKIRGDVMIREISTARNYKPREKQSWPDPQVMDNWEVPYRFTVDHMTWSDQDTILNEGSDRTQIFINMRKKLKTRCVTSLAHFLEDQCWALPVWADMEKFNGRVPNSLALFCNELEGSAGTNHGLFYSYRTAGGGNNEVMGLSKTEYGPTWDNARVGYKRAGLITSGSGRHLFEAFDDLILECSIKQLPGPDGPAASPSTSTHNVAVTNKKGFTQFQAALRMNQDYFRMGEQDPAYPGPKFDGIQLLYIPALNTAAIYPTGQNAAYGAETAYSTWDDTTNNSAYDDEAGTDNVNNDGPRYHVLDFDWLHKGFHKARYFKMLGRKDPTDQVADHVVPVDNWHQNFCRDMRRQGCIYPTASIA